MGIGPKWSVSVSVGVGVGGDFHSLNHPLIRSVALLSLLILSLFWGPEAKGQSKPNIIIMLTDDQGYGDVGFHGNPYLQTPNMESIAEQGIEMTYFYSYPNCSPTRAALLTGRYPYRTGVVGVTQVDHLMNASEVTLAEILGAYGYSTGIFGKWHLGDNYPMRPTDQGFQEALVHKGGGIGQAAGPAGNSYFDPILEHNNVSKQYSGYCDNIFTDAALDFIETNKDQPFFLYLATNLPHFPLTVPDSLADPYRKKGLHEDNARTYGMMARIDYNVGRVLNQVKNQGIEEQTIIIFLSDNGPRQRRTKNDVYPGRWVANLRGTKTSVYEAGIRVPFFVRWPQRLAAGKQIATMGAVIDIFPTILDAADISADGLQIDGQSLLPLWTGQSIEFEDRYLFTQMHVGPTVFKYMHFAVRNQQYKLVSPHDDPHHIVYQPTDDELKATLANLELFDITNDPSERVDLAAQYPEVVESMLLQYESWYDEVTQERDAKGIQRIFLGYQAQTEVILSRFDWGGPRVISKNKLGHWRVRTEPGTYEITLDLPNRNATGVAHLKYQDLHLTQPVLAGQEKLIFEGVNLPGGTGNLQAYLKFEQLPEGPLFVRVKRLEL